MNTYETRTTEIKSYIPVDGPEYFFIDTYFVAFSVAVLHVDHTFILKVAAGHPC